MEVPFSLICITLIAIVFLNHLIFKGKKPNPKPNQPPWPRGFPVIGNLHQLGRLPHRSLESFSRRYGQLMLLRFGRVPVLIVSSADAAEEVMKTHDREFANRPKTKMADKLTKGGRGIAFAPYGEYWRQMKSICVLRLLSNKMVRSFQNVREEEINLTMDEIAKASSSSVSVNLSTLFGILTGNVILRIAVGKKYSGEEGTTNLKHIIKELSDLFVEINIGEYIPSLSWIDKIRGLNARIGHVSDKLDDLLEKIVEDHLEGEQENVDFVNVLLSIQRENKDEQEIDKNDIKAIILDVIIGGMHTTATVLEWAMTELLRNPKCMRKLKDEIGSIHRRNSDVVSEEETTNMTYLKAVIREAMRLHPPVPLIIGRQLTQDVKLMGYDIAASTHVIINAWAIQRNVAAWGSDAEEYRPERHLDSSMDFMGQDFNFIPFGAGRRMCPGIGFALTLVQATLANVVCRFDWKEEDVETGGERVDLAEASSFVAHRKFPIIAFPSSTSSAL